MSKVAWANDNVSYNIFKAKYAANDSETPEQFCKRVASIVTNSDNRKAVFEDRKSVV